MLRLLAVLFAFNAVHTYADTTAPASTQRTSASFRFLTWDAEDTASLAAHGNAGAVMLDRPSGRFGHPVRLAPGKDGRIGVHTTTPPKDPKQLPLIDDRTPAAFAFAPLATPRQLVIILPDKKSRRTWLIEDSEPRFPFGSTMVINLTSGQIECGIGGAVSTISPGADRVIRSAASTTDETPVSVRSRRGKETKLLYSTVWIASEDIRTLVFIEEAPSHEIRVRTVFDRRSVVTAEAPAEKSAGGKGASQSRR